MRFAWLPLAPLALVALATSACRAPTQITFAITTDVACSSLDDTAFTSGPLAALDDGRPAVAVAHGCASAGTIGSVVVIPSGSDTDLVAIKVVTGVGVEPDQCGPTTPCIVARRALRFIPNTPLVVNIDMSTLCEGVVCDGDQTCERGQCVSAIIGNPSQCEGAGCGGDVLTPEDGGARAPDAGSDGAVPFDATVPVEASSDAAPPDAAPPPDATTPRDAGLTAAVIGVGSTASCALLSDGTVQCWGADDEGALGDDASTDGIAYLPQPVPGLAHVTAIAVGYDHTCVVVPGGAVECWGYGGNGALGSGPEIGSESVPTPVTGGGSMSALVAGHSHTCGVGVDGVTLSCWGAYDSSYGTNGSDVPVTLATLDAGIVEMGAGQAITCALTRDGDVWCWGENNDGTLGQGDGLSLDASVVTPLRVSLGEPAIHVAAADFHACAVGASHRLFCWGDGSVGQFGPLVIPDGGSYLTSPALVPVAEGHVMQLGTGDGQTCALLDDAGVQCWGYNYGGQLAIPGPNEVLSPISIANLGAVSELYVHFDSACAKLVAGGVACWGNDSTGELGIGASIPQNDAGGPTGAFPVTFR